jgi:phage terminase large subunit-like protein
VALPAGPKRKDLRRLPPVPTGGVVEWLEMVTGEPLYGWQAEDMEELCGEGRPRVAYEQVARKNGKTRKAADLALAEVCLKERRHVYCISDSERNLNSSLIREIRDVIGASEHLRDSLLIFKNHIEVPETGSFIETRPNNFRASQSINPHLVLFDEVHLQRTADIWHGMEMAGAARADALLFGITTPGYDLTSLAHDLYQAVRVGDPTIHGRIFEADPAADIDDEDMWRAANPCIDRPGFLDGLRFDRQRLPEHEFRRYRLGQWTATDQAWLPYGAWALCSAPGRPTPGPGEKVWLGFDGSFSGDSTALVGVSEDHHVFVVGCWENPGRPGWRVPRARVKEALSDAFDTWKVQELLVDPPYWESELAEWSATWPRQVVEFRTNLRAKMAPACTAFYSAVLERTLTHDGDPRLARHVSNAVVKASPVGDYIVKADKDSPAKIDLAVAAVIAYHAAATAQPARRRPVFVL